MTHRERFRSTMALEPLDRLPAIEWAGWWDQTLDRWHAEDLPEALTDAFEIRTYWGLDPYLQCWIGATGPQCPQPESRYGGLVSTQAEYEALLPHLYPEDAFRTQLVKDLPSASRRQDAVIWVSLEGFFWFARKLLGVERHLCAFYDHPKLMHRINQDLLAFNLRVFQEACAELSPAFMTFAEDMSYNHGPMISRDLFYEFMAPYYREILPAIKAQGTVPFVDTDGNVTDLVLWFLDVGMEGFLPLEHQAHVDVAALRESYPSLKMIGAYDKMAMSQGEQAMRAEWERLLPVMRQGGFIPAVDHQTPPQVSMADYRTYRRLQDEYCTRAAQEREPALAESVKPDA